MTAKEDPVMNEAAPELGAPARRLLSGLYVPEYLDETAMETTAPIDVVDQSTPAPAPATPAPAPATPAPAPGVSAAVPAVPVAAPAPTMLAPRPEPVVVETAPRRITPPAKPDASKFKMEKALTVGYWMSVGVGVVGQVASFGGMIAEGLSGNMKLLGYAAAALGAAFAEITMVGCGTAALKRRYEGGRWKALAVASWIVCLYAVVLNALHWAPINVGLAVMFAGGSALGFSAHSIAEHLAARDYEDKLADYHAAVAEAEEQRDRQAEEQRKAAEAARKAAERQHRTLDQPTKKTPTAAEPTRPVGMRSPGKTAGNRRATKTDALRVGIQRKAGTPAKLRDALREAGYSLPASSTTVENWCKEIKTQLSTN